jgi:hypothetical protein
VWWAVFLGSVLFLVLFCVELVECSETRINFTSVDLKLWQLSVCVWQLMSDYWLDEQSVFNDIGSDATWIVICKYGYKCRVPYEDVRTGEHQQYFVLYGIRIANSTYDGVLGKKTSLCHRGWAAKGLNIGAWQTFKGELHYSEIDVELFKTYKIEYEIFYAGPVQFCSTFGLTFAVCSSIVCFSKSVKFILSFFIKVFLSISSSIMCN